jgi:hypothetical protein
MLGRALVPTAPPPPAARANETTERGVELSLGKPTHARADLTSAAPYRRPVLGFTSNPTQPIRSRLAKVLFGARRAVPADKAECRLWVQKGDDRRNAPQRARCADSSHTTDMAGLALRTEPESRSHNATRFSEV